MSNGYGAYGQGGNVVPADDWGEAGVAVPLDPADLLPRPAAQPQQALTYGQPGPPAPPPVPAGGDPPPAALYSADPGNGQAGIPWLSADSQGNLYVYGQSVTVAQNQPELTVTTLVVSVVQGFDYRLDQSGLFLYQTVS